MANVLLASDVEAVCEKETVLGDELRAAGKLDIFTIFYNTAQKRRFWRTLPVRAKKCWNVSFTGNDTFNWTAVKRLAER